MELSASPGAMHRLMAAAAAMIIVAGASTPISQPPSDRAADDAVATGQVEAAVVDGPAPKEQGMGVMTQDGVEQLRRLVDEQNENFTEENIGRDVAGVDVKNELEIRSRRRDDPERF